MNKSKSLSSVEITPFFEALKIGTSEGSVFVVYWLPPAVKGPLESFSGAFFFLYLPADIPRRKFNVSNFIRRIHLRRLCVIR
jgi:hypothetical protein